MAKLMWGPIADRDMTPSGIQLFAPLLAAYVRIRLSAQQQGGSAITGTPRRLVVERLDESGLIVAPDILVYTEIGESIVVPIDWSPKTSIFAQTLDTAVFLKPFDGMNDYRVEAWVPTGVN